MSSSTKTVAPLTMLVLGLLMGLPPIATDLYLPAMPSIAEGLSASPQAVQQTLSLYLLLFSVCQLIFGPLCDSLGRRPVMIIGLGVFCSASALCAAVTEINALILLRGLQGVGAAAIAVTVPAIIRDQASGAAFSRVMGFVMMVMALAPLVAPLLGSMILVFFGWRAIFVLLALVACAVMLIYILTLGETMERSRRVSPHMANVLRNYLQVAHNRHALCYMLCSALATAGMFAFLTASPFVYIEFYGVSEQGYGLLFAVNILMLIAMASVSNRLVSRCGPQRMLGKAMVMVFIAAGLLLTAANANDPEFWVLVLAVVLFIGTAGVINANAMALVLDRLGGVSGSASAVAGSLRFGMGAGASMAAAALFDGTPLALAVVMGGCGVGAVTFFVVALCLPEPENSPGTS